MSQAQMTSMIKISSLFALFVLIYAGSGNVVQGQETVAVLLGGSSILSCHLEGHNLRNLNWSRSSGVDSNKRLERFEQNQNKTGTHVTMTIKFENVSREDNGTYHCQGTEDGQTISNTSYLKVIEKPEIEQFVAKAVMVGKLYLSWKVYDGNDHVSKYSFFYRLNGTAAALYFADSATWEDLHYYVLNLKDDLKNGSAYNIGITASNEGGTSPELYAQDSVTPLEEDFIPTPVTNGTTDDSITLIWTSPAADLQDYYNYTVMWNEVDKNTSTTYIVKNNTLTIESLQPETKYQFKVRACIINYPDLCGNWSSEVEGQTINAKNSPRISSSSNALEINIVTVTMLSLYYLY